MTTPKTVLEGGEYVVLVQVCDDMFTDYVLEYFTGHARKGDWEIVTRVVHIAFLEHRCDKCVCPVLRELCFSKRLVVQGCEARG